MASSEVRTSPLDPAGTVGERVVNPAGRVGERVVGGRKVSRQRSGASGA